MTTTNTTSKLRLFLWRCAAVDFRVIGDREREQLRASLGPRIERASVDRSKLVRQLASDNQHGYLQTRLQEIDRTLDQWRSRLSAKAQRCAALAQRAATARQRYFADLDVERKGLVERRDMQTAAADTRSRR